MKNLLFIPLMFLRLTLYSQSYVVVKPSQLPAATTINPTDIFVGNQGTTTKKFAYSVLNTVLKDTFPSRNEFWDSIADVRASGGGTANLASGFLYWNPDSLSYWPYPDYASAKKGGLYLDGSGYTMDTSLAANSVTQPGFYGYSVDSYGVGGESENSIAGYFYSANNLGLQASTLNGLNNALFGSGGDSVTFPREGGVIGYNNGTQLFDIGTSDHSLGIGLNAYNVKSGIANIGIGYNALSSNNSSGNYNTAIGHQPLVSIRDASNNIAIGGFRPLYQHRTGGGNIAIGSNVLSLDTSGIANTAVGDGSMNSNRLGYDNSAFGAQSLQSSTGNSNIAIGATAGKYNVAQSGRLYINSLSRTNILGDTTKSIIYGLQAANTVDQKLYLNARTKISTGTNDSIIIDPANGIKYYKGGALKFKVDTGGLVYNNIPHCALYRNTDLTISASQNVWHKITGFTTKDADYFTVQGDSVQFQKAGHYKIEFTASFSGLNNEVWELGVFKGGALEQPSQLRYTSTSDVGNMSCPVYISVSANQWISFKIRNTTDNDDPTIKRFSAIISTIHLTP